MDGVSPSRLTLENLYPALLTNSCFSWCLLTSSLQWLWSIISLRVVFVFPLCVIEKSCVDRCSGIFMMDCVIQNCHPFICFFSCSFWGLHIHALSLPSNFDTLITNTCAEKEEIADLQCLWSMNHAEKNRSR